MDHHQALNRLKSTELLNQALKYALYGREYEEKFYDATEIDWVDNYRDEIIAEIQGELKNIDDFTTRVAFAYFTPKTSLCDRRMVCLPLKDLIVRNALVILFAEHIERDLHDCSFGHRRATDDDARKYLLENFETHGWQRFCEWQRKQCEIHSTLIRTDISSFYDSISHEYLIDAIERHLLLPRTTPIMRLFAKLLKVKVMFYSSSSGEIAESAIMHQGLPIGDATSSYLSNIYLKDLDDAMARIGNGYGRFADDMRIFAKDRESALYYLKILQQQLLKLGLNLNSAKTEIAGNQEELEKVVSKNHALDASYYSDHDIEYEGIRQKADLPLNVFRKHFKISDFKNTEDLNGKAKDFCKFLAAVKKNGTLLIALNKRRLWHINVLKDIVITQRGSIIHATWLLVQSAIHDEMQPKIRNAAQKVVCDIVLDSSASPFARYRLLRHLLKPRKNKKLYFHKLYPEYQEKLKSCLHGLISAQAFELNLIAIHFARIIGLPLKEIQLRIKNHCANNCEPVKVAISRFANDNAFKLDMATPAKSKDTDIIVL